jgi:hypothetical protein
MFATRRSRVLVLLGTVALVGWMAARTRRRKPAPAEARPARAPDGVASEDVTDDVHDADAEADAATEDLAVVAVEAVPDAIQDGAIQDDRREAATDEPVVTARVYETSAPPVVDEPAAPAIDLARIERDLEGVETALRRLDDGTYWIDEITGEPLAESVLVADPVARRNVA